VHTLPFELCASFNKEVGLMFLRAALIAAAIAVAAVGPAAPSHADPGDFASYGSKGDYSAFAFRNELRYVGLYHEDEHNAADLAGRLCAERADGYTERQVMRHLENNPDDYTVNQIVAMVLGAEWHFCPDYYVPSR
jgi:hypothetical protein